jgi:diguanylate cyclase (GGDEF)-like protein/putative nucleotidyltransferase with HDIG domain
VNGLKLINDSFGHALGDELLKKAAEIIKNTCRSDDIIARLGGDEFVIILPKTDVEHAEKIVERLSAKTSQEKVGSIELSICFGFESKTDDTQNIQEILTKAENHMYRHKLYKSSSMRSKTVDIVMKTLFEKSVREMAHSKRVSELCGSIARQIPFDSEAISQIITAGLMHDIGKIGIEETILNKPQKLDDEEWVEMKKHPEVGWRILSSVDEFSELAQFILEHHERWDGRGYPKGMMRDEISMEGRIIALADSYDAMTSQRTYRKALSEEEAVIEIKRCSGTQFDPVIARIFIEKVLGKKW